MMQSDTLPRDVYLMPWRTLDDRVVLVAVDQEGRCVEQVTASAAEDAESERLWAELDRRRPALQLVRGGAA